MAATAENKYLWHQRLGHLNFNDINKIPECTLGPSNHLKMKAPGQQVC